MISKNDFIMINYSQFVAKSAPDELLNQARLEQAITTFGKIYDFLRENYPPSQIVPAGTVVSLKGS